MSKQASRAGDATPAISSVLEAFPGVSKTLEGMRAQIEKSVRDKGEHHLSLNTEY